MLGTLFTSLIAVVLEIMIVPIFLSQKTNNGPKSQRGAGSEEPQ